MVPFNPGKESYLQQAQRNSLVKLVIPCPQNAQNSEKKINKEKASVHVLHCSTTPWLGKWPLLSSRTLQPVAE